ncbi:MAG: formylglycine-generating enzyme family protein [Planctomycetaceae bacterium]|nr:formylglycine-generating enzyme family protein [Planctomycetaceae bacterium]
MKTTFTLFLSCLCCLFFYAVSFGQTPAPPTEAAEAWNSALKSLKDSNWKQADESFDLVLLFAPKYAPAHIGKLCVELKVPEERFLGNIEPPVGIDELPNFKTALENADPAYKRQIQGYADTLNLRLKAMLERVPKDNRKAGERVELKIKGIDYAFRWCPAGTFLMGSPQNEADRRDTENQHRVTLSSGFWMLETEVTQGMWASVMGNNPSYFKGIKLPVEQVSWDDCQEYIKKLNGLGIAPKGFKFSLPTEAQWEYACRAGTTGAYGGTGKLDDMGWYSDNSGGTTHVVGTKRANAWGLFDMHGNVWEWCSDLYGDYPNGAVTDPVGANTGSFRVFRGGSWFCSAEYCRSAVRGYDTPGNRYHRLGFRLSLVRFSPESVMSVLAFVSGCSTVR